MYKQSVSSIKLVIIPVDGVLFNLNKLRYNYCKNFAESKGLELSKLDFYKRLSNNFDMYDQLSFSDSINISSFSLQIENDLRSYFQYHPLETKPGAQAFFEGIKNKGIKIAVISTHKEEDARFYLNKSGLIRYCDLVVGCDNGIRPLPSNDILKAIQSKYEVLSEDVLVISSFTSLNKAAESLANNIIYVKDMENPTQYDVASSYKCVNDLYDALNIILFDRYDDASLYANVLGFNAKMTRGQLADRYNHLLSIYSDDAEIISVVEKTYKEYVKRLNDGIVYVDYPSDKINISDHKRQDITQEVQKSILKDTQDATEQFKEETVEMMVRKLADVDEIEPEDQTVAPVKDQTLSVEERIVEKQPAKQNVFEEKPAPEKIADDEPEEEKEDLEITNSRLVTELFKESNQKKTSKPVETQGYNTQVKLQLNKLRASLDDDMLDQTGELLNPQMMEYVTEEHSTPTFRVIAEQEKSNTIVLDPDDAISETIELENVDEDVMPRSSHNVQSSDRMPSSPAHINNIDDYDDDDYEDNKKQSQRKHSSSHSSGYSFTDWLIDMLLVILISLLITVICAIFNIIFIQRGIITTSVVLKAVNYITVYVNFVVSILGKILSKIISDSYILALVCVYIFNTVILMILSTIINCIRKR